MLIAISFSNPGLKCSATLYVPGGMEERFTNAKRAREFRGLQRRRQGQCTKREDVDADEPTVHIRLQMPIPMY